MNTARTMVPAPIALKQLILSSNELLRVHQETLKEQVQNANMEMMQILGLDPREGWRLDMEKLAYIKIDASEVSGAEAPVN